MRIVPNRIFPFRGFKAMTVWPFVFVRRPYGLSARDLNHEHIHSHQQKELLVLPFFLWYAVEWIFRLLQYRNRKDAYRNISFEREAYANESDLSYVENRKAFSFIKYIKL